MNIGREGLVECPVPSGQRDSAPTNPIERGSDRRRHALLGALLASVVLAAWTTRHLAPEPATAAAAAESPVRTVEAEPAPARELSAVRADSPRDFSSIRQSAYQPGRLMQDIHGLQALHDAGASPEELLAQARSIWRALLEAGPEAIAEALEFLRSGEDVALDSRAGSDFDFQTLRLALIDALRRIGGAEAERGLLEQLESTASVIELEALAAALDELQPEYYRDVILDTALAFLLELSTREGSASPLETAPLFRVLQSFGDEHMAPVLRDAPNWFDAYATVALANLPGERSVDFLAGMARRELHHTSNSRALHLIAQAADREPGAEQVLRDLMLAGEIPDDAWPEIADILIGDRQLQLEEPPTDPRFIGSLRGSNPFAVHTIVDRQVQQVYSVNYSAVLSADQAAARLDRIDRLLAVAPSPAARASLWAARDLLGSAY